MWINFYFPEQPVFSSLIIQNFVIVALQILNIANFTGSACPLKVDRLKVFLALGAIPCPLPSPMFLFLQYRGPCAAPALDMSDSDLHGDAPYFRDP